MNKEKQNTEKKLAAEKSAEFVKDGMSIGLGSGSTMFFAIKKLGELARSGLQFRAVSTSDTTTKLALSSGIKIISLDEVEQLDLTIDGADEVDYSFNGIKGGGGALLFEKIVALYSKENIWIVDSAKIVKRLGKFPLPVEVVPFGHKRVGRILEEMRLNPVLRKNGADNYLTDSGNFIFDLHLNEINDSVKLDTQLKQINGVIETGLFINIAGMVIVGKDNSTEILKK